MISITVSAKVLSDALDKIGIALDDKAKLPAHTNYLLLGHPSGRLIVQGQNQGQRMRGEARIDARVTEPVAAGLNAKTLRGIVGSLPNVPVTLEFIERTVRINAAASSFSLPYVCEDNFPRGLDYDQLPFAEIKIPAFTSALQRVMFAAAKEEELNYNRKAYFAVCMNPEHFVATDGKKLAFIANPVGMPKDRHHLVPTESCEKLVKAYRGLGEKGFCCFTEDSLHLSCSGIFMSARLYADNYFPYGAHLKSQGPHVPCTVTRTALVEALKRVSLVSDTNGTVLFIFDPGRLTVATKGAAGEAIEQVDCEFNSDTTVEVKFNSRYLLEALDELKEEKTVMEVRSGEKLLVFREKDYVAAIMPVIN